MPSTQERINEGRFLAAARIENRVLADGVLPTLPLADRSAVVQGIVQGLLEQGKIGEAIRLVYQPGPAKALFENYKALADDVIKYARQHQLQGFAESDIKLLAGNKQTTLLYRMATELPLKDTCLERIVDVVAEHLSPEQLTPLYDELGNRYLKADLGAALTYFQRSGNQEAVAKVESILMEDPAAHFELLVRRIDGNAQDKAERLTSIVRKVLQQPGQKRGPGLYSLWRHNTLNLTKDEVQQIKEHLASSMRVYDLSEMNNIGPVYGQEERQELRLLWAKKHWLEHPRTAYKIFCDQQYESPEVLSALQKGLERSLQRHHGDGEAIDTLTYIKREHLEALLERVPLTLKAHLAEYLEKKPLLLELSREFAAAGDDWVAYNLWIRGDGDLRDPYVAGLRQRLIDKEFSNKYGPSPSFLKPRDSVGHRQMFSLLIDKYPREAYTVARRLDDETLLDQARQNLVTDNPFRALDFFFSDEDHPDPKGRELAYQQIARQYDVAVETIQKHLQK